MEKRRNANRVKGPKTGRQRSRKPVVLYPAAALARLLHRLRKSLPGDLLQNAGEIYYIGGSDVLPQPLTPEEERELTERMQEAAGEEREELRKTLIERNLRLVVFIAKRFESGGTGLEDLISIGTIGLIKAVNTFNPEKNIKLATYASRCIENEILMHLRRSSKIRAEVSIDEPLNVDWDGNELLLSDILGTEEDMVHDHLEEEVNRNLLEYALNRLSRRERVIMELRFGLKNGHELTQKEVADRLGISQSYISRLEKRIILRLQKEIRKLG
ncbi:MAG: RNA polymerase sporulation sigma factor SigE [Clostridiales bacterium]|nr:RNA polymerase sporulation sigma factor SigE [Clostridiales bacterium]